MDMRLKTILNHYRFITITDFLKVGKKIKIWINDKQLLINVGYDDTGRFVQSTSRGRSSLVVDSQNCS